MEVSFRKVSVTDNSAAHIRLGSPALKTTPIGASIQFTWKDQGVKNQKGKVYLVLMSPEGEEDVVHSLTPGICPHDWEAINVELVATDSVLARATVGCWYQIKAYAFNATGFELYVKDLVMHLTENVAQLVKGDISFGDFSVFGGTAHMEEDGLHTAPVTGTISCKWKDQGSGPQTGALILKLMSPDGEEKASFPLSEGVAPHEWEDLRIELVATDPVLALAETGCRYLVVAKAGGSTQSELHVKSLVLKLSGDPIQTKEFSIAAIAIIQREGSVQLKWNCEELQTPPVFGTVQCKWMDQGWGIQQGKLYLKLFSPGGAEKASISLTEGFAPRDWEDINVDLAGTASILSEATVGCWYELKLDGGNGRGFKLHVEDFTMRLSV